MRLKDVVIVIEEEKTLGKLRFSGMRREVENRDADGNFISVVRRTYDLKCSAQEQMIQVSLPAEVAAKNFEYNQEVELVNPVFGTVSNGNVSNWFIRADDIRLATGKPMSSILDEDKPTAPSGGNPANANKK